MNVVENIIKKLFRPKTRLEKISDLTAIARKQKKQKANSIISSEDLISFEQRFGVTLPDEYREYIQRVSNGGVGPLYGLLTLKESIEVTNRFGKGLPNDIFSTEFPHVKYYNPAEDPYWENLSDQVDRKEISYENYIVKYRYVSAGTLPISSGGCGTYARLVITGPARGQIWGDDVHNDNGYVPVENDFFTWIEKRLQ